MRKSVFLCWILLICLACSLQNPAKGVVYGHAHNDYENENPLMEALENAFISVEVDVHYIEGELLVSHDRPNNLKTTPTLKELYLEPLKKWIDKHSGSVYVGYDGFFYLMIDIKTEAKPSYNKLKKVLEKYASIISISQGDKDELHKPVKVFVSGFHGRPFDQIISSRVKIAGLDGREKELGRGYSKATMPIVSENYNKYLSWDGVTGEPSLKESLKLKQFIDKAHLEDKMVRLWAIPDTPKAWDFLMGTGVDLINTDSINAFSSFYKKNKR